MCTAQFMDMVRQEGPNRFRRSSPGWWKGHGIPGIWGIVKKTPRADQGPVSMALKLLSEPGWTRPHHFQHEP